MDAVNDQNAAPPARTSKLRYPLRSAAKPKDVKPPAADALAASNGSPARRGRVLPSASQIVSVLDASGKDKTDTTVKTPGRFSIPPKLPTKRVTPISEIRINKPDGQGKIGTAASDVRKSTSRRKSNALSSACYWLSQSNLCVSASKHSISLGFFKLALESGCEVIGLVMRRLTKAKKLCSEAVRASNSSQP